MYKHFLIPKRRSFFAHENCDNNSSIKDFTIFKIKKLKNSIVMIYIKYNLIRHSNYTKQWKIIKKNIVENRFSMQTLPFFGVATFNRQDI